MIKIYTKDDTTAGGMAPPSVSIPSELAFSPEGCSITFRVCGISRTLASFEAGGTIPLDFSAAEMTRVRRGVHFGELTIRDAYGRRYTVSSTIRVLFTDNLAEARDADYEQVDDSRQVLKVSNIPDLPPEFTENELREKLNEVLKFVRGGTTTLVLALIACATAIGAEVQTAPKGEVRNTAPIVTNVTGLADLPTKAEVTAEIGRVIQSSGSVTPQMATNAAEAVVQRDVPEWARAANPPESGVDVGAVKQIIDAEVGGTNTLTHGGPYLSDEGGLVKGGLNLWKEGADIFLMVGGGIASWNKPTRWSYGSIIVGEGPYSEEDGNRGHTTTITGRSIMKDGKEVATEEQVTEVSKSVSDLGQTVSAWQTYWDGDDVRVTVTNYYGSAGTPSLYLEQKMPADEDHEASWFKVVWDERTRWNLFLPGYNSFTNDVAENKADRAWGVYDSATGAYSPDGLIQLSQDQIMIASGLSYQKTVTSGGNAVWVLKATDPQHYSGELSDGYFRIQDSDGNPLFEVVKGDKRVVGATATSVNMESGSMVIGYNSVSAEHPRLEVCTDLRTADWATEENGSVGGFATVSWAGESGAWFATVTPVGSRPSLFAKASFEAGGNTYIRNHVASTLDKVVVGGVEYTVRVETVNGKKLLVLQ